MMPGIKYQIVEVQVLSGSTQPSFNFPPQPFLVGKKICSIESFTVTDMPVSPVYQNALPTKAQCLSLFFTFYGADPDAPQNSAPVGTLGQQPAQGNWLRTIPFVKLHCTNNFADPFNYDPFELEPRNIAWEQSNIFTVASGGLAPDTNISIVLLVGYTGLETGQSN